MERTCSQRKKKTLLEAESFGKVRSGTSSVRDSAHLLGLSFIKFSAWILITYCQQKRRQSLGDYTDYYVDVSFGFCLLH